MTGSENLWSEPEAGTSLVAAYHAVVETPQGLTIQRFQDTTLANAFVVMTQAPSASVSGSK